MSSISNRVKITFISNGYLNFSKSLLITTTHENYLINCGEGTQKLFLEYGSKIGGLRNIFFTNKSRNNMNGMIGVGLGLVSNGISKITFHGVRDAIDLVNLSKKIDEKTCQISFHDDLTYETDVLRVDKFLYNSTNNRCRDSDLCCGYYFSTAKMRPNLNIEKCKSLSFPNTFMKSARMKEFFEQSHVKVSDDLIIESKDVLIDPPIPENFLVFECPSVDHIAELSEKLPYEKFHNSEGVLRLVIHLTDKEIFETNEYQALIKRINTKFSDCPLPVHSVVDSNCDIHPSYSSYYLQSILNYYFDEDVFPKLKLYEEYKEKHRDNLPFKTVNVQSLVDDGKAYDIVYAEPHMEFYINNFKKESNNFCSEMWLKLKNCDRDEIIKEIIYENKASPLNFLMENMNTLKKEISLIKDTFSEIPENYPNITFIGTSSSIPNKYRNISAILVQPYENTYVLFDCGEGTLDRLLLLHGIEQTKTIIRNMRMICISHHHLDHHSGLYTLLKYRQLIGDCNTCLLMTTRNVFQFSKGYDEFFQTDCSSYQCDWLMLDLMNIPNNHLALHDYPITKLRNFEKELGITLTPVRVYHTTTSFGFVITGNRKDSNKKWKITYSGDRMPKFTELLKEGINSDILIHEATMDDGLEEMALIKRHSTVSQAIEEGNKMNAKFTMLTHFSSRYPLVPPFNTDNENVAQAFDFLKINLHTCKYLKLLDQHLEYLFPQHYQELIVKRQKRIHLNKKRKLNDD